MPVIIWKSDLKSFHKAATFLFYYFLITLIGCGGGGGGGDGNDDESRNSPDTIVYQGVFLDSSVEGLNFSTDTFSGITDSHGTFNYLNGEKVKFSIENITLGECYGNDIITPLDMFNDANNETDQRVTNICRLLQMLDFDGNPINGITITDKIYDIALDNIIINFDQSVEDFENDNEVLSLISNLNINKGFIENPTSLRKLPSIQSVQNHFRQTLKNIANIYDNDVEDDVHIEEIDLTPKIISGNWNYILYNQNGCEEHFSRPNMNVFTWLITPGSENSFIFKDSEFHNGYIKDEKFLIFERIFQNYFSLKEIKEKIYAWQSHPIQALAGYVFSGYGELNVYIVRQLSCPVNDNYFVRLNMINPRHFNTLKWRWRCRDNTSTRNRLRYICQNVSINAHR